ncbi:PucR family transcriptional regulator [Paenibacillus yanchengensis]|uniref:PucR family transcriptional regulator n=1 Tax=Paenibacillus yanchengensis TaxID=2035833 RepID=A0ABW4YH05_9BACL
MNKPEWVHTLQHILNCQININKMTLSNWQMMIDNELLEKHTLDNEASRSFGNSGDYLINSKVLSYILFIDENQVILAELPYIEKATERNLIGLLIKQNVVMGDMIDPSPAISEKERGALKIAEWLNDQLQAAEPAHFLPDHLVVGSRMYTEMIPFLLVTEHLNMEQVKYSELEKLLRSFLADEVLLIPLRSEEWLIWGPVSLFRDEDDVLDMQEEESAEEALASMALGLNEMLASEWLGDCHLAVAHPVSPANSMVETVQLLRETINLGRKFHIGTTIHLPWMLQLERIINAIPESHRVKYLEQSLKKADLFVESEMLATLETFFSLDCNVSETAKRLYIHRNTLLYRLDKLKQETGLDVRLFRDAVLVKIILLLYKVTKRN